MGKWTSFRAPVFILPLLMLAGGSSHAATQGPTAAPSAESPVDPQARSALTRMSDYLKSLEAFALHEDITREQVINGDLKVEKASTAEIVVRRPDGLKAQIVGDDAKSHAIYFDGKTLALYLPDRRYYAQMQAPGTIGAAIDEAESHYGLEFPTPDLLRTVSGGELGKELTSAGYVGTSPVDHTDCEHFAYRTADLDYQIWIQTGDRPLPRKFVITSKKQATQPEYTAILSWDLSPKIGDSTFAFTAPEGVAKIPFGSVKSGAAKKAAPQPQNQFQTK